MNKVPLLPVAMALAERGQAPRGVLLATLNLTWLSEQILKRGIPEGGSVTIADRHGTIIARQPLPDRYVGTRIPDDFLHLLAEKAPSSLEVMSQDGTRRLLGYVPLAASPSGLYVSAGLSSEASFDYLTRANLRQLIVTVLSILAALLAAILAARYFVETPIQQIVDTCRRWQKGDTTARTALSARDGELGLIGEELDSAIGKLAAREDTIRVLMRELEHRTKNQLSIVLALARQISKDVATPEEFYQELTGRLQALAASHDILLRNEQRTGTIREIVEAQLRLFCLAGSDRVRHSGPDVQLPANDAQFLGMAFYELLTNAEKYGVLSSEKGRLVIKWHLTENDQQSVELVWWESDGRAVAEPEKTVFGGMLVNKIVPLQLRGTASSSFGRDGFRWVIQFPLKAELAAS